MSLSGQLTKLEHQRDKPIQYHLRLGNERISLNDLLEKRITISFEDKIECIACGRVIKKTYNSGYCYPCFRDLPENDLCIVKPSLCHHHKGTCRDSQWGESHCMQPHIVYLAISSELKVGLTRRDNHFSRWTDQGAVEGLVLAELPTRKLAGELELALAEHVSDRTDWRRMLQNRVTDRDLAQARTELIERVPAEYRQYLLPAQEIVQLSIPWWLRHQSLSPLTC